MRAISWCSLALVVVAGCGAPDAGDPWSVTSLPPGPVPSTLRVLFIGNSYLAAGDLPRIVESLVERDGRTLVTQSVEALIQGATLEDHVRRGALERIARGPWNYVIIQGRGHEPLTQPASFFQNAAVLARAARAAGAVPVLFETWARRPHHPDYAQQWTGGSPARMQALLRRAYWTAAADTGSLYAPAGDAWELALAESPSLPLHGSDGAHPSETGVYLAARVVANLVTHTIITDEKPPAGLSPRQVDVIGRAAAAVFGR